MKVTENIKNSFNTWLPVMEKFIVSPEMDKLFAFLKSETIKGKSVLPESKNLFKVFELCPRDSVKCIIIEQDPYNTKTKDGKVIASGIPMDCSLTGKLQPSLSTFYEAAEEQLGGFNPMIDLRADNSYFVREEGVLLLNSALTVEYLKPGSHEYNWVPFMQYLIEEVINVFYRGLPVVLLGTQAQKLEKYINPMIHHILKVEHPAFAARENRKWRSQDMFLWINNIIKQNNGPEHQIKWLRLQGEVGEQLPDWVTQSMYKKSAINENEVIGHDLPWQKK